MDTRDLGDNDTTTVEHFPRTVRVHTYRYDRFSQTCTLLGACYAGEPAVVASGGAYRATTILGTA